jgi:hypothetical protein
MLMDEFFLSQDHTKNFFGEEFLKNNIKNTKKKINELKCGINDPIRNL